MIVVGVAEGAEIAEALMLLIKVVELVSASDILISFITALTLLVHLIIDFK